MIMKENSKFLITLQSFDRNRAGRTWIKIVGPEKGQSYAERRGKIVRQIARVQGNELSRRIGDPTLAFNAIYPTRSVRRAVMSPRLYRKVFADNETRLRAGIPL